MSFNIENKENANPEISSKSPKDIGDSGFQSDESSVIELDSAQVFPRNCPVYDDCKWDAPWNHPFAKRVEDAIRITYKEWKTPCGKNGWYRSTLKEDLVIFRKPRQGRSVDIIKGRCVIPFSLEMVVTEMMSRKSKLEYEPNLESCKEIKEYGPGALLEYSLAKTPSRFIAQRDTCMAFGTVQLLEKGGPIMVAYASVASPLCPIIEKYVRCEVISAGWVFEADKRLGTIVTTIMDIDVKASYIPGWILNLANECIGEAGYKLKKYMEKKYKNNIISEIV